GRTTQHKSEGVQEDDKTSTVLSTGTSPEHTRTWLTQNLGLPAEEVSTAKYGAHTTFPPLHAASLRREHVKLSSNKSSRPEILQHNPLAEQSSCDLCSAGVL
ncbi:hypothetical protein Taro_029185, partial [Colocasia esculenta]|nr:hypothetical protein [Colocasia esculenta]